MYPPFFMERFRPVKPEAFQPGFGVEPPELEIAAATTNSNNRGTMTPPADEEVAAATTSGSITGSTTPPAKDEVAASDNAAASAIFFI
jgi:hypothetical protein